MRSCLVIKTSSLGDILQTIPAILALKKAYPDCWISWVVEKKCQSLLEDFTFIDELIVSDFKSWKKQPLKSIRHILSFKKAIQKKRFDLAIDFQANSKSGLILSWANAAEKRSFHRSQVSEWPHRLVKSNRIFANASHVYDFNFSLLSDYARDKNWDLPSLKAHRDVCVPKDKKVIMLGLSSMWPSKTLNDTQISQLIASLEEKYHPYFLIPALKEDKEKYQTYLSGYHGEVILEDKLSSYAAYLLKTDLFVGVDSALLHLARLFKVPARGLFGPSSLEFYGSDGDIQGVCPYQQTFAKRCSKLRHCHAPCMKGQSLDL